MKRTLLFLCLALPAPGCSPAFWTEVQYQDGRDQLPRSLPENLEGREKSWIIGQLGPPDVILPRMGGDTFIYRNRSLDFWVLRVRPTLMNNPAIYTRTEGTRSIRRLNIYFDRDGTVRNVSFPQADPFR